MFVLYTALLLFTVFSFVHFMTAYSEQLKLWWLRQYKDYPDRRSRCNRVSRTIQDVLFKLDHDQYRLTHAECVKDMLQVDSVLCCIVKDADLVQELRQTRTPIQWGKDRNLQGVDLANRLCHHFEAIDIQPYDITKHIAELWKCSANGTISFDYEELIDEGELLLLSIRYRGHGSSSKGVAAMPYTAVYMGAAEETLNFPPHDPSVHAARGLGVKRIVNATTGFYDVTEQLQALCGPLGDFYESTISLDYPKLWFALWIQDLINDLGEITVENSQLDTLII
jgi:hypothetical protein